MDKEIEAKVEEFVKSYGRRELSMDEADKVSGGIDGLTDRYGNYHTAQEVNDFAFSMLDQFG